MDTSRGDGRGLPVTELRRGRLTPENTSLTMHVWNKVSVLYLICFHILMIRNAVVAPLFNFALEYLIKNVQVNQVGLELNGTDKLLVTGDSPSRNTNAIIKNRKSLV